MTVDDFEMARGRRVGQEEAHERWKDLADLRDGRREKWMTDRAKHALGTPKLSSIFLQEEKGRILRLRKIKSVLASGKLMGSGPTTSSSSTQQPDRRGRRRPYPNSSQQHSHHHHYHTSHRKFQQANDASLHGVQPNYPTNPFGNVDKDALQFPAPMGRKRTSLEEAVRHGRTEATNPQATLHNNSSGSNGRSGTVWDDDSRAIQEVVSVLAGSKEGLYGSRGDLRNNSSSEAPSATVNENNQMYSQYRGHSSRDDGNCERGQSRHSPESPASRSRADEAGSQAISSGPSAIDLFDQCGLVPVAAVEKEGLVGTTDMIQSSADTTDGRDHTPSVADSTLAEYPVAPARVAPRPPLVPGGPSSATNDPPGARTHPRDAGRHEERAARAKRGAQPAATHGVKPRPPFAGGSVSTLSRTKQAQQQTPSSSVKDAVAGPSKPSRSVGRGAPSDAAAAAESSSRRFRVEGASNADSHSAARTERRTRRRWNTGEGTPQTGGGGGGAAAAAPLPKAPPRSESSSVSASMLVSATLSAAEQRITSAKERLHKDKGLNALKSEHVEALSILQDISCPSTAAGVGEAERSSSKTATGGNEGGKETTTGAVDVARIALLRERKNSSANATGGSSAVAALGGEVGQQGPPVDDKFDELSADLPRIGSKEQAALRTMYRKWWMKVANGGSPPSPCTPVGPVEKGTPPVAHQHLPVQGGVTGGNKTGTAESLVTTAAANTSENGRSPDSDRAELRQNDPLLCLQKEPASAPAVFEPPPKLEVVAAVAAMEKDRDNSNPTRATGESGCRAEEKADSSTGKEVEGRPPEDGDAAGNTPHHAEAESTSTQPVETQGGGEAAAARDALAVSEQRQQQQQGASSDVESISEDDGLEKEQEEGHHGRIYLPDGRFVSTWRNSSSEEAATDAVMATLGNVEKGGGGKGDCGEVLDYSVTKQTADAESLGYADEDFEFED